MRRNGGSWSWRGRRGWRETERTGANFFQHLTVLFAETQPERFFGFGVEGQEVEIIIGAAMQDAATSINGGVDERASGAGIFGLPVIEVSADVNICVMTENHGDGPR